MNLKKELRKLHPSALSKEIIEVLKERIHGLQGEDSAYLNVSKMEGHLPEIQAWLRLKGYQSGMVALFGVQELKIQQAITPEPPDQACQDRILALLRGYAEQGLTQATLIENDHPQDEPEEVARWLESLGLQVTQDHYELEVTWGACKEVTIVKPPAKEAPPMQPISRDEQGVIRFDSNSIVSYLLDAGPFDMNTLAMLPGVSRRERAQFAQLIGYAVSSYGDLSYSLDVDLADAKAQELYDTHQEDEVST